MLTAALCAGNCYLLPLDTVPLITYSKGYYSMTEMMKSTFLLQISMIILCSVWLPLLSNLFLFQRLGILLRRFNNKKTAFLAVSRQG